MLVVASRALDAPVAANGSVWLRLDACDESATTTAAAHAVLLTPAAPQAAAGPLPHSVRCLPAGFPFFFLRIGLVSQDDQDGMSQQR